MPREQPDVRTELLVEELLQLERPRTLAGIARIERGLGHRFLERGDDLGGVADRPAVELQDGERVAAASRQDEGDRDVRARGRGAPLVLDSLVLERPASLLVVVRDADVPEDGLHVHLTGRR
jgi:hypothetical protein